jgi:hypothetical protein
MTQGTEQKPKHNPAGDAVAWFAVLENARKRADFQRAAQAKQQLERLGVAVTYLSLEKGESDAR